MSKTSVYLSCCMCDNSVTFDIELPVQYTNVDLYSENEAFCPDCSKLQDWIDKQCNGCVSGWKDCSFTNDFKWRQLRLSDVDFEWVKKGICPRRLKNSVLIEANKLTDIDYSIASEVGEEMYNTIMSYRKRNYEGND